MRLTVSLAALAVMASCASLSESECRRGAWYDVGLTDGARGQRASYIAEHSKACGEFGITPDAHEWQRGRDAGLNQYCTAANAYYVGTTGTRLSPVCREEDANALQLANLRGLNWHRIGREIDKTRQEIPGNQHAASGASGRQRRTCIAGVAARLSPSRSLESTGAKDALSLSTLTLLGAGGRT